MAISYVKSMLDVAERLYTMTKRDELLEIVDSYYNFIENYELNPHQRDTRPGKLFN